MHYHVEVVIPVHGDVRREVEMALAPYCEDNETPGDPSGTFSWDWYQIGGRWKGVHAVNYDQETDPDHKKVCSLCAGTGTRPGGAEKFGKAWVAEMNGCNGCAGTGQATTWPTEWSPHPKDVVYLWEVREDLTCYHLVVNGKVYSQERWTGSKFETTDFDGNVRKKLNKLKLRSGRIVTVDIHC